MKFSVLWAWYDFWIGAYYDVGHQTLYICPLPTCVLRFEFSGVKDESKHRQDRLNQVKTNLSLDRIAEDLSNEIYLYRTNSRSRLKQLLIEFAEEIKGHEGK